MCGCVHASVGVCMHQWACACISGRVHASVGVCMHQWVCAWECFIACGIPVKCVHHSHPSEIMHRMVCVCTYVLTYVCMCVCVCLSTYVWTVHVYVRKESVVQYVCVCVIGVPVALRKLSEKHKNVEGKVERRDVIKEYSNYHSQVW